MEEFQIYEFVVSPPKGGKTLIKRILMVCAYVLFDLGLALLVLFNPAFTPLFTFSALATVFLIWLTWRFTSVEYEYSMISGEITFSKIYGGRTRKQLLSFRLKDCTMIAPAGVREWQERAELFGAEKSLSALSRPDADDAYFATFEGEKGVKHIVYFEATERALKICRFYNPSATVITKVSR